MPSCGSQCYLCDLPIRFDTYKGCTHACEYCFVKRNNYKLSEIDMGESPNQLISFINGVRGNETNWCDWNIPLHWGGMSDPFQPCEKKYRRSYECLKVFAKTHYPVVISTKGKLIVEEDYLDLLSKCNAVVQISAVCSSYDKMERGAPTYEERLNMASILSKKVKRVIIRIQPYMHEVFDEVYANLDKIAKTGAYGVIIEGMKYVKKRTGLIKVGGDYVYPYDVIKEDFLRLQQKAHKLGLKIYAGENRLRKYGDSLTCCGIDGLEGFKPNTYNLNHILKGDITEPTKAMRQVGTSKCFAALDMTSRYHNVLKERSFAYNMCAYYKEKKPLVDAVLGVKEK